MALKIQKLEINSKTNSFSLAAWEDGTLAENQVAITGTINLDENASLSENSLRAKQRAAEILEKTLALLRSK